MSHFISLETAIDMTTLYRNNENTILDPEYQDRGILALSETFDREAFDYLLDQTGCEKLRIYYGMDEGYKVHAIVVGVNGDGEDMIPSPKNTFEILEIGERCPSMCPPDSPLNS